MTLTTQTWQIGDAYELMKNQPSNTVDLGLTDPPYGYSFMGKDWDRAVPTVDLWKEFHRVLKPGAFAFIMSAPRQDVLAHNLVNLSDAGFDTSFTSIYWTYASGFPKASNIGKMVDKRLGVEREVIGKKENLNSYSDIGFSSGEGNFKKCLIDITAPSSPQAKELDGSYGGFQPKPAVEIIMVVMKPLSEKTYVDQAMANQKGITWLDDGRIPYQSDDDKLSAKPGSMNYNPEKRSNNELAGAIKGMLENNSGEYEQPQGRFPANLLVSDDILNDGKLTKSNPHPRTNSPNKANVYGEYAKYTNSGGWNDSGSFSRYFDLDAWWDDQIRHLPKEVQKTFPFIIMPKASKKEKMGSTHPTIKPLKLFTYLMIIGSRVGDLVLDPFLGSGPTLQSGRLLDRFVIGYELDSQWEPGYNLRVMKNIPSLLSFG